jgi:HK97 family phage portal protein
MIDRYAKSRMQELFVKAALPVVSPWLGASFTLPTFRNLTREAYQRNSTFFACVSAYTFAFPEPPLRIYRNDETLPEHPLRRLLRSPNPIMGEPEFWGAVVEWLAIGGNAYIHKVRNRSGRVVELWPYHSGLIQPIPGGDTWIRAYQYDPGNGQRQELPTQDVIHIKWPAIDPDQPWMAQPPLRAASHGTDTNNELTRFLNAALRNDAIPRTVIELPEEHDVRPEEMERMKQQFMVRYGQDNVGKPAVLELGAQIKRIALDMEELAAPFLANFTDTEITKAMRVPPVLAATLAGIESSTYANYETARRIFTEDTLQALWVLVAGEINSALVLDFDRALTAAFDTSKVRALQENENEAHARNLADFQAGTIRLNEYRRMRGFEELPDGDVFYLPMNVVISPTPRDVFAVQPAPEPAPEQRALPVPTPEYKTLQPDAGQKQRSVRALGRLRTRIRRRMRQYLSGQYRLAAEWIRENAPETEQRSAPDVDLMLPVEYKAPVWVEQIPMDFGDEISGIFRRYHIQASELAFGDASALLDLDLAFDVENERVQEVLDLLAQQVRRVSDTTREDIRKLVGLQASEGWSIDDLAAEILKRSEIETPNRARLIARTETARAYSEGSLLAYGDSGVVDRVEWLVTDPCPICQPLAGQTAPVGGEFAQGIRVPGDPHPGCRCALAPIVEV